MDVSILSYCKPYHRYTLALCILSASLPALAGPPLATEDPGILGAGEWEVIAATSASSSGNVDTYQVPMLDISLGIIEDKLQIAAAYPYVYIDSDDGSSDSEFGNLEIGAKWRFWNEGKLQLALAPVYSFGVTRANAIKGVGDEGDVALIPVAAEYQLDPAWRINTMLAYASAENARDQWEYGVALAHSITSRWELLFEFAGASDTDFNDDSLNVRAGFDFALSDRLHLLFSAATGLREARDENELDYDVYFAAQWFL
ncbi:MAG: transporter [Halieaceae bacterium]